MKDKIETAGWKFVHSNYPYAYRMHGFPTDTAFKQYIGDSESLLIPIHYDMCVSLELIDIYLQTKCKLGGKFQLVVDCFYDPTTNRPTDFVKQTPCVTTAQNFLSIHS